MVLRSPVCVVVGHVDHGKSSVLDYIRSSNIVAGEAGAITQSIGASIIPTETIVKKCGGLLEKLNLKLNIPGLLFIDTPGHEAFTNLRKRGGSLADIAILVVDINEGFKPQTFEALEILKSYKTPFLVCANKVDLISGYKVMPNKPTIAALNDQSPQTITEFETKMYQLVGTMYDKGFPTERYDRVSDFTKEIAIIPTSAKFGIGIPEVLMVLAALSQKYLEKNLVCDIKSVARGTILEVKEEKGLGTTLDVILYDGCMSAGDTIIIGNVEAPVVTKIRALLVPEPNTEMRDKKGKFKSVKSVVAATGVKISAPNLDGVIGGMPILSTGDSTKVEELKEQVMAEIDEVLVENDESGIIVKADSLGALEALVSLLRQRNISVMRASIGDITRKDIIEAQSNINNPLNTVIVGFNSKLNSDAEEMLEKSGIKVITSNIIYNIIDNIGEWRDQKIKEIELAKLDEVTRPAKLHIMPGLIFRQSHPVVCGVDVLAGVVKINAPLMKDGKFLTNVKSMELDKKSVRTASRGEQVAMAMDGVTIGRQLDEDNILYTSVNEEDFKKLKTMKNLLSKDEVEVLKEIAEIMRKTNPSWGI